jgi:murein DD-endopeptidase MepM/ murein hydrolase activator NlpD
MRAATLLALVLTALPVRAKVWAVVTPPAVEPGGVFQVKSGDTADPEATATVRFRGATVPLVPVRGVLRALLGVPASAKAGYLPVAVRVSGREILLRIRVKSRWFSSQSVRVSAGRARLMSRDIVTREWAVLRSVLGVRSPAPHWFGGFARPVSGPVTSPWGRRRTVNGRPWGQHQGTDIRAPEGAAVVAGNSGVVVLARRLQVRGNTVIIDHGLGVFSVYCHLSRVSVREGESVERAQRLGAVGSTGLSSGPHLHWEIRIGTTSVNPQPILESGLPLG